jgi:hypothetical protein
MGLAKFKIDLEAKLFLKLSFSVKKIGIKPFLFSILPAMLLDNRSGKRIKFEVTKLEHVSSSWEFEVLT